MFIHSLNFTTAGRGTLDITNEIAAVVKISRIKEGMCHLFLQHTSASLLLCENADFTVRQDLENFMGKFIPDDHPDFKHNAEGKDDMPAHLRTVFTQSSLLIPFRGGQLALGKWQGVFLWEHRFKPHHRHLIVSIFT